VKADLKRASSLLAKLQPTTPAERKLNPKQMEWLTAWRKRQSSKGDMNADNAAAYYALSLEDGWIDPDPIRSDIATILDPAYARCRILETDDAESAALKYQEYCQN